METRCLWICIFGLLLKGSLAVDSLRFLALGDWGGLPKFPYRTPVETAVGKQMAMVTEAYQTSFNLALGDNFYFDGVKDVEDKRFFETFESVYHYDSLKNDWYFVAGNHDHNGNVSAEIDYSTKSKRWNFPNYYYKKSFQIPEDKTLDVIMIDTVLLCGNTKDDRLHLQPEAPKDYKVSEDQWAWIEEQLSDSKADYLLVAGHFPVFSTAEHGPTKCLVDRLDPLLFKYNVTAYLCGHDHNLQHLQTSKGLQTMDYFVTGAANFVENSQAHKDDLPKDALKFFWAELADLGGFSYVEATPKNMTLIFVDGKQKPLYRHTMFPRK